MGKSMYAVQKKERYPGQTDYGPITRTANSDVVTSLKPNFRRISSVRSLPSREEVKPVRKGTFVCSPAWQHEPFISKYHLALTRTHF